MYSVIMKTEDWPFAIPTGISGILGTSRYSSTLRLANDCSLRTLWMKRVVKMLYQYVVRKTI
jgi:hypothetical protein